jgi:hypothetical protein
MIHLKMGKNRKYYHGLPEYPEQDNYTDKAYYFHLFT